MTFRAIKRGNWYSYELDGARLPSVTKLIGDGIPKPNLIDWAAKSAAEYAADHLDEISRLDRDACVDVVRNAHRRTSSAAAAKGHIIHDAGQAVAEGRQVEIPLELAGYIGAYAQWLEDWRPEFIALERPVVNRRWRYAGRFDALVTMAGETAIVDTKSGGSGIWPETCLQVAAYRAADAYLDADNVEQPMPATDAGYALWLLDDGNYELVPVASGPDVFSVFLHAAHIAAFQARAKDDLIGLPLPTPVPA